MTNQTLTLEACKALAVMGFPQGTERVPSTLLRWLVPASYPTGYVTAALWINGRTYACPDSMAALDWLQPRGVLWRKAATGYWYLPVGGVLQGPYDSPSALILAAQEEAK